MIILNIFIDLYMIKYYLLFIIKELNNIFCSNI